MNPYTIEPGRRKLLSHVSRWGSDGYPVHKLGSGWTWGNDDVHGPPVAFKTKREAVASFERFYEIMVNESGAESAWRAGYEAAQRGASIGDNWCDEAREGFRAYV